ncbi:MAG: PLP-dependent aminotransferase family protein [Candidatus Melainabacteria bacterium]|nr:MAG: PLP-dependent aminotransferase family protein [Candidatus Melainabacteria bacterium]
MQFFPIKLNSELPAPLYRQLADAFRDAVSTGLLKQGDIVPTTRKLSETLGVSRQTVISAYELLVSQNVLQTSSSGTTVLAAPDIKSAQPGPSDQPHVDFSSRISVFAKRACQLGEPSELEDFSTGAPPISQFPIKLWRRHLAKHALRNSELLQPSQDSFGLRALRDAIAGYLGRAQGIACSGEQISIHSGGHPTLEFIVKLLIDPGDRVVVEDPGNAGSRRIFSAHQAELIPVPVDSDGIDVEKLFAIKDDVKLLFISPSHQQPTGAVLSPSRRDALLNWANERDVIIIENHYDSEFRYTSRPMPALFGSNNQRVIYMSTFWKVLGPVVRNGFTVLPKDLLPVAKSVRQVAERDALSLIEQHAMADFIEDGDLERTIKRNKTVYLERRNVLIAALGDRLSRHVYFSKEAAGLHQYIRFDDYKTQTEIMELARAAALPLIPIDSYYLNPRISNEYVVPFAQMTPREINDSVQSFTQGFFS